MKQEKLTPEHIMGAGEKYIAAIEVQKDASAPAMPEPIRRETELRDYVENANVCMHWVDAYGIIKWANKAELNLLGYIEEEYIGHHISEFHVHREKIDDILTRLSCSEELNKYESELRCKNGSVKTVHINSSVYSENGKFIHTRCVTIDITEEKRLWEALAVSEDRYKSLLSNLPAAVYTCDKEGRITFFNEVAVQLWGYRPDKANPYLKFCACYKVFVNGQYIAPEQTPMAMALQTGQSFRNVEAQVQRPNGELFYAAVNIDPTFDSENNVTGAINIFQDISAVKHAENALRESEARYRQLAESLEAKVQEKTKDLVRKTEELEASEDRLKESLAQLEFQNRELEQFVYAASHDLKEPLRKITLYSNYIADNTTNQLDEKSRDYLTRSIGAVGRMKTLIDDLLVYSRSTSVGEQVENTDLNIIFHEIADHYKDTLEQIGGHLTISELPVIKGIPFQIKQLFYNLVDNAVKYRNPNHLLNITVKQDVVNTADVKGLDNKFEQYHRISITDNGIGFDAQYSNKIFEIFQRLHSKSKVAGTGIGLAICKKIVQNHHGHIEATGEPDKGATFNVYFPL